MNLDSPRRGLVVALALAMAVVVPASRAEPFTFDTPGGPVTIELTHAGPQGDLVTPGEASPPPFRPPAIFSAPLPSGSGARALGFAGAFTAVADDATAASWNPAGLTQLERPEASVMMRASRERDRHRSGDADFQVGRDSYDTANLNYLSLVYPFHVVPLGRNAVVSLNYQEAYDFSQKFTADLHGGSSAREQSSASGTFQETQTDVVRDDVFDITIRSYKTTRTTSTFDQLLASDLVSDLDFDQEGVVAALSPAVAMDLTPKLALGLAVNAYGTDVFSGRQIQSRTRAAYSGRTDSRVNGTTSRTTTGTYDYNGQVHLPPGGGIPVPITVDVEDGGPFDPFTDTSTSRRQDLVEVDGVYEEENTFRAMHGYNATIGLLGTINRYVSVGASLDLPWTASAEQTQTTHNRATTYNQARTQVLGQVDDRTTVVKDVEFTFPLYWALGTVVRWTPAFYTTLDLSQTLWSDFAFQAQDGPKINPLDGSAHGENPLDDTWAARAGLEYLVYLKKTEIPLRAGFGWEQRPALERPDDYYSVALGSGFSLGLDPGRTIVDLAYIYTFASDVQGVVPEQKSLKSDVGEHQGYVSVIQHF